jgi:hypothetical protein
MTEDDDVLKIFLKRLWALNTHKGTGNINTIYHKTIFENTSKQWKN